LNYLVDSDGANRNRVSAAEEAGEEAEVETDLEDLSETIEQTRH
jgi:hypothetical protein